MAGSILVVTEDEILLDDLLRLCAAVGAPAEVAPTVAREDVGTAGALSASPPDPARQGPPVPTALTTGALTTGALTTEALTTGGRGGGPPGEAVPRRPLVPSHSSGPLRGPVAADSAVPPRAASPRPKLPRPEPPPEAAEHAGPPLSSWGQWGQASLVLVGDDRATQLRGVPRRPGVLLVSRDADDHGVWERGVGLGAEQVLVLPSDESRLVDRLSDAAENGSGLARTIGVIGGRGGAGASTLACALALAAAHRGERTMLIDGDPLGGGLEVLLGAERLDGLRWPALRDSRGRIGGAALEEALPRPHGVSVLSWDRSDCLSVPAAAMCSVLGAARRCCDVVVIDLPRRFDEPAGEALCQLDLGLLVVPAELPAVAAAQRVATQVAPVLRDLRVVTRGDGGRALDDVEVARLLDLPLAGAVPTEHGLAEAVDGGSPPGAAGRGPLARFCARFWSEALAGAGEAVRA